MSFRTEAARVADLVAGTFDKVRRDSHGHAHINLKLSAQTLRRHRIVDAASGGHAGRTALERSLVGYRLVLRHELFDVIESRLAKGGWDADLRGLCFAWRSRAPVLRMKLEPIAIIHDRADFILTILDPEDCSSLIYFHLAIVRDQLSAELQLNHRSK